MEDVNMILIDYILFSGTKKLAVISSLGLYKSFNYKLS